jgi:hypothetical protein
MSLPTEAKARKETPITRGVLDYFPDAIAAVAELSRIGNDQHNPGQPMHWDRTKSTDHADCITRHLIERGTLDTDGVRHATKVAWRGLALLQTEIEEARKPKLSPYKAEELRKFGDTTGDPLERLCKDCGRNYGVHCGNICPPAPVCAIEVREKSKTPRNRAYCQACYDLYGMTDRCTEAV